MTDPHTIDTVKGLVKGSTRDRHATTTRLIQEFYDRPQMAKALAEAEGRSLVELPDTSEVDDVSVREVEAFLDSVQKRRAAHIHG